MQLDHVIVAVADLEQAMADYRAVGFSVFFGGEHAGGVTHNALICFADGSYIELIAPVISGTAPEVSPYLGVGKGFAGFALLADDLHDLAARLRMHHMIVDGPKPGGRRTPDGQTLQWESLFLQGSVAPFFIRDVTPRSLRVPDDSAKLSHANGAIGVQMLEVASPDLKRTVRLFDAIFESPGLDGGTMRGYSLQGTKLGLRAANSDDLVAATGPFPVRCVLASTAAQRESRLDHERTHGARFELMSVDRDKTG